MSSYRNNSFFQTGWTEDISEAAPREIFYRYAGKQMGMIGNNGTADVGYDRSIRDRSATSPEITSGTAGLFRNGRKDGSAFYADFSQSLDAYNSSNQGSAGGGTYTVRSGDTLQAIAAALYGDGNLWYRLAEANGISGQSALVEGQSLILPAGITKNTHNAGTFMPYDASEAMGDTLPTTPKPPKKPKCGVFGQFLMTAIAVAVVVLTQQYEVFAALGPVLGGAAGAAAGSIVSQGFGVATGIESKFSFKQVAMAGLSGGIGAGVGQVLGTGAIAGSQLVGDVVRGVASSALTQGVAVATGLQKKFSWTGVAAAGIGAGIAGAVTRGLSKGSFAKDGTTQATDANGNALYKDANGKLTTEVTKDIAYAGKGDWVSGGPVGFGVHAAATMADTIAQAATRSVIKGNSFGDNLIASLPSALGNLAGRALATGIGTAFDGKSSKPQEEPTKVEETKGNKAAHTVKSQLQSGEPYMAPAPVEELVFGCGGIPVNVGGGAANSNTSGWRWGGPPGSRPIFRHPDGYVIYETADGGVDILYPSKPAKSLRESDKPISRPKPKPTVRRSDRSGADNGYVASASETIYVTAPSTSGTVHKVAMDVPLSVTVDDTVISTQISLDSATATAQTWLDNQLASVESTAKSGMMPTDRYRLIFAANFTHAIASGVAAIPSIVAHPVESLKAPFIAAAKGVDRMLAVNSIPAKDYLPYQWNRLRNTSADDFAAIAGKGAAMAVPTRLLPKTRFAPESKFADDQIDPQARLRRVRFSADLIRRMGPAPVGMKNPHRHHILGVNGRAGEHRALVREGQQILEDVGINPLTDMENLVWAPNKGHTMAEAKALVERLRLEQGSREGILEVLSDFGTRAANR